MAVRILVASLISAVVVFAWGFLFWGVSGASQALLTPLPETSRIDLLAVLRRDNLPPGMYIYPAPSSGAADQAALDDFNHRHEEGPLLQLALHDGAPPMQPGTFALGAGLNFVYALLAGAMVAIAGAGLPTFGRRLAFLAAFALAGAIWTNLGDVIWWFHPVRYGLGNAAYQLIAGLLTALIIAAIVKPRATTLAAAR